MEVIGGVSAIIQVTTFSLILSQKLASFISEARDVVETNTRILDQLQTLHDTVSAVNHVLNRREQRKGIQPLTDAEVEIQDHTRKALRETDQTFERLKSKIEKLGGGRNQPEWWKKGWIQMKAQVQSQSIAKIEWQMGMNIKSLQLMILCVQS